MAWPLSHLLDKLVRRSRVSTQHVPRGRPRRIRLEAEPLEPRWVPSLTTLWSFSTNPINGVNNGAHPESGVILTGGVLRGTTRLVGTTNQGGSSGNGEVFEVILSNGGSQTSIGTAPLSASLGGHPVGNLIEDSSGDFIGTASSGGSSGGGTIFELTNTGTLTDLASFNTANYGGVDPLGGVVEDSAGNLFGSTYEGGITYDGAPPTGWGALYELPTGSPTIKTVARLPTLNPLSDTADSALTSAPVGNVINIEPGNPSFDALYGIAEGGAYTDPITGKPYYADGCVFEDGYNGPFAYPFEALYTFTGTSANGYMPQPGLVQDGDGNLFGTTLYDQFDSSSGQGVGDGLVFELTFPSNTIPGQESVLGRFSGNNGTYPQNGVIEDSNGNLFGTTTQGGHFNDGTLFEIPADSPPDSAAGSTRTIVTLHSFDGSDGANPFASLTEDGSGNLYGTTLNGGAQNLGTVFELQPPQITTTTLANWTVNQPGYLQTISAINGTGPYVFSVSSGTLPVGLTLNNTTGVISGTPNTQGTYTFTVTATDNEGDNPLQTYTVTINPPLTVQTSVLPADPVGTPYNQTQLFSGGTYYYTCTVMGTLPPGLTLYGGASILYGTPTTAGTYNFTVMATDAAGASISQSYSLLITSGPLKILTTSLPDWTANQPGYSQTITVAGGVEPYTFMTSGNIPPGLTMSSSGVISGTPTGLYFGNFKVIVSDGVPADGMPSQSYILDINVPVAIDTTALPNGTAGTPYNQTISVGGGTGTLTFSATGPVPAGLTLNSTAVLSSTGVLGGVLSGTPTTAGNYTFTVTITDTTGASASQSYTVSISPGPFTQYLLTTLSGTSPITAGSFFLVTVQATDEDSNPITTGYTGPSTVTVQCSPTSGTSNFPATLAIGNNGQGLFLGLLDTAGTYTLSAASGIFASNAVTLTVAPAPAAKLVFVAQPAATPTGVALPIVKVQVQDAYGNVITSDNSDAVTLSVASGTGSFMASSTTTATVSAGTATFSNLTLIVPGTYTLGASVLNHFNTTSAAFSVVPLQVVPGSFVGTPSGFSLQFNAPFLANSATPVLYGQGFGATAPAPSVTLTQILDSGGDSVSIPVTGSLVLNTTTNTLTFLATNTSLEASNGSPLLPDGSYVVAVHSSAAKNGFHALNPGGGFLDGVGNGSPGSGNFTALFSVGAASAKDDVIWVPATADGPGEALNAPGMNQAGGGYPIYLNDTTGSVTNVQVTLSYNPALLTVSGATGAGFSLLTSSTPGQAVLQYSGPALPAGKQTTIGFLIASVPSGTTSNPIPYKAKDLLHLSNVSLNGGAIKLATSDGLHLVAYVGDADGNGSYSSNDAVLITRALLSTDTGFAAYPLVDPVIVADIDGSGFIPADAALQVNEAGVGFPTANLPIPPIPGGVHFQAHINRVQDVPTEPRALPEVNRPVAAPFQRRLPRKVTNAGPGALMDLSLSIFSE